MQESLGVIPSTAIHKENESLRAGKMAQWIKIFVAKSELGFWDSHVCRGKGENQFSRADF